MPRKRVTLADVARRAGLSTTAASMILNGRPDTRLSKEAHERVHAAAAELGYRPNVAARGLRTAKTLTIGFVSDTVTTTRFAGGLIKGALEAAEEARHVVLLAETGGESEREAEAIAALLDRQVDGIVFATVRARELFVPALPEGVPAVMLNATSSRFPATVLPDEEPGGRAAVRLLVDAGHSEGIALIGQSDTAERDVFRSRTIARRVAGIRGEMADKGLGFVAEESIWMWEPQHGYDAVLDLLRRRTDVRALLCMNDRLAFGAYQAAAELGLRVPDDLSVVSFDDDEVAAYLRPGLTTIGLPHEAMGRRAVELLLGREPAGEELVPMPVVERASIGPPRGR
ncbi:LacI family DNA-binding transcriptional regulator [Streptomyces calidiresistens]|uniref:Substrate-binding domain-containing protein n=1 Tax=Streptomyces calidiresistens TaxID=1485586 RepID=A0A7W3T4D8_9ACTN|nr:LacI family DNA-binding transcriptional regulator [Streptomyces calidiresistens]MBB0230703.1 substrate-binding domain-containing protein [Streptomyces calidiresistens]